MSIEITFPNWTEIFIRALVIFSFVTILAREAARIFADHERRRK